MALAIRRVCPDVVIEILSSSDSWPDLVRKLESHIANGAEFVVAIDPYEHRFETRGTAPAGLQLDFEAITNA